MNEIMQRNKTALMPDSLEGKLTMAELFLKSGIMPKDMNTKEKVFIALQYGHELGLSPMVSVQNIAVINGRPSLSTSLIKALVFEADILDDYKEIELVKDNSVFGYTVTCKRKNFNNIFDATFSLDDALQAGLILGIKDGKILAEKATWRGYTKDMLLYRAISRCLKKAVPEFFKGILTKEEAMDIDPEIDNKIPAEKVLKEIKVDIIKNENEEKKAEVIPAAFDPIKAKNEVLDAARKVYNQLSKDELNYYIQLKSKAEYTESDFNADKEKLNCICERLLQEEKKKLEIQNEKEGEPDPDFEVMEKAFEKKDEELPRGVL